jgi:formylglycine-generating enzyme required for sulfatase activity
MNKKNTVLAMLILSFMCASASDFKIEVIEWTRIDQTEYHVKIDLSWNNAWHNSRNYDAAWIFFKYKATNTFFTADEYLHALVEPTGHRLLINHVPGSPGPVFETSEDRRGMFIYCSSAFRGNLKWTLEITLDKTILSDPAFGNNKYLLDAFGIEMVYIPAGTFTLGDPDSLARKHYSFFKSGENGQPDGLYTISSEEEITVGKNKSNLYYMSDRANLRGDQKGIIPQTFPKGYQAFYIMKYETSQGLYAQFLNSLSSYASHQRVNFAGKQYYKYRGSIVMKDDKYEALAPERPCNFISWDDACALADWAALRPMTELEFEKACRGPLKPISHEYPWNTNTKDNLQRYVNKDNNLVWSDGVKESDLTDKNRDKFGASYFWVMDLSGSQWERCVTVGDSTGRSFQGSHGDGVLSGSGFATNKDWPTGSSQTSGFGFRGGAYYEHNRPYGDFWPQCPIAYRDFASWAGGSRVLSYSSRFVRAVEKTSVIK